MWIRTAAAVCSHFDPFLCMKRWLAYFLSWFARCFCLSRRRCRTQEYLTLSKDEIHCRDSDISADPWRYFWIKAKSKRKEHCMFFADALEFVNFVTAFTYCMPMIFALQHFSSKWQPTTSFHVPSQSRIHPSFALICDFISAIAPIPPHTLHPFTPFRPQRMHTKRADVSH